MSALVPCPSCARHVRASESACPFCSSVLPANLAAGSVPAANTRLSRVAAFTFATTLAVVGAVAAGCSSGSDDSNESEDKLAGFLPMYGAPIPHLDAGQGEGGTGDGGAGHYDAGAVDGGAVDGGAGYDGGGMHALYGAPPEPVHDGGGIHALYGAPSFDDEAQKQ